MTTDELAKAFFGKPVVDRVAEELGTPTPSLQVHEKPKKSRKPSGIKGKHN
jgi:hypothetical protein